MKKLKKQKEFIIAHKKKKGCFSCGWNEHSEVLELHHVIKRSKEDLSNGRGRISSHMTIKAIKEEMKKCVVLCPNCHRSFHRGLINLKENRHSRRRTMRFLALAKYIELNRGKHQSQLVDIFECKHLKDNVFLFT